VGWKGRGCQLGGGRGGRQGFLSLSQREGRDDRTNLVMSPLLNTVRGRTVSGRNVSGRTLQESYSDTLLPLTVSA
jgi:hypothetical protein